MKDLLSSIKLKKNKLLERFSCHFLWSKEKKAYLSDKQRVFPQIEIESSEQQIVS